MEYVKDDCECCGAEGVDCGKFTRCPTATKTTLIVLCRLCANTIGGRSEYPRYYGTEAFETQKLICFVGNAIIKAIRESGQMK